MIKLLLILFVLYQGVLASKTSFELSFFSPDQEKFSEYGKIPEIEFRSYIENNPYHIAKTPMIIAKFNPPTPYFKIEWDKIIFYYTSKRKKSNCEYQFNVTNNNTLLKPMIKGGKKSYNEFGKASQIKKTFYLLLPHQIYNSRQFHLVIKKVKNQQSEQSVHTFYHSKSRNSYSTRTEIRNKKIYNNLLNKNHYSILDQSGKFFFKIDLSTYKQKCFLKVSIKNLSNHSVDIIKNNFLIHFENYRTLSPNLKSFESVSLLSGQIRQIELEYDLPELPKINKAIANLSFNQGEIIFSKKIIF